MSEPSVALTPFALAGVPPAEALLPWTWNYTGADIAASGTFTTTSRPDAAGDYEILGVTGSRNGVPILSLEPAASAIPGNAGYPVDDLISPNGALTANGFGYETVDGSYANPYYANFLTPSIYQEVYTTPSSSGFAELPIEFQAEQVPGITVATVAPAWSEKPPVLRLLQAPVSGTVALSGATVQYMPATTKLAGAVSFNFDLTDQQGNTTPVITVIAAGDGSWSVTAAASGHTNIALGNGNDAVALRGGNNTTTLGNGDHLVSGGAGHNEVVAGNGNSVIVLPGNDNTVRVGDGRATVSFNGAGNSLTLGSGIAVVRGGHDDTIHLAGNTRLLVQGTSEMVFLGSGNASLTDLSTRLRIAVGAAPGNNVLAGLNADPGFVVDLGAAKGMFDDPLAVLSALKGDGRGGALLPLGNGGSLDFAGIAVSRLHATNFHVG